MKKHIILILVLMTFCVICIIGLQLFWNLQNYRSTVSAFDHDINEALHIAVERETDHRQNLIVERFKGWLADTSLIVITADHNNRDSNTVFHTRDRYPKYAEDNKKGMTFGLTAFRQKLNKINPAAKAIMINHFGDRILKNDLKEGAVYHYTQMLGDSLEKVYSDSKVDVLILSRLFKEELAKRNVRTNFVLNPVSKRNYYLTKTVNTNFRKPYEKDLVYAGFESPDVYFFNEMKWVIISTFLLFVITFACFTYTVRILLSQDKIARLKDDFINNMTHELNTPLASIKITADALKSFDYGPAMRKEYLDIITFQADKLIGMAGQILSNSGMGSTQKVSFELGGVIQTAINDLTPQSEQANALICYNPSSKNIFISGNPESLRSALVNLIDNALKYTAGNPEITIDVTVVDGFVELTMADNGIGIPELYQLKVFDKFFRVPYGNRHDVKGYGLGLSYVSEVVKQHCGKAVISGNVPAGTKVTLKLPI
jgi:two-component system phosphate regulon sensor histidine kinase PhoR